MGRIREMAIGLAVCAILAVSAPVWGSPSPLPGDANQDGLVDVSDLGSLAAHYGIDGDFGLAEGDFNSDGIVDVSDLGILASNYGTSVPVSLKGAPQQSSLPEPGSFLIWLGLCVVGVVCWRRYKPYANEFAT
ncbi:MAG: hypothetical protein JXM70_22825 [Pirellulales bacterium]|nr:hypothetical protein [Pirellulales bacterium]